MITQATTILSNLEKELSKIQVNYKNELEGYKQAIKTCLLAVDDCNALVTSNTFHKKSQEIEFYKVVKPKIESKLIYYCTINNIEVNKPIGTKRELHKYYKKESKKIKLFFKINKEFIKYYKSNNTYLDKTHFKRQKIEKLAIIEWQSLVTSPDLNANYNSKVAQIIAYDEIKAILKEKIEYKTKEEVKNCCLNWTSSKVNLIELMYALYYDGAFNNGKASLNEIAQIFQNTFQINLNQFNRTYLEIKSRKTIEKTNFINTLKEKLKQKIEEADGK